MSPRTPPHTYPQTSGPSCPSLRRTSRAARPPTRPPDSPRADNSVRQISRWSTRTKRSSTAGQYSAFFCHFFQSSAKVEGGYWNTLFCSSVQTACIHITACSVYRYDKCSLRHTFPCEIFFRFNNIYRQPLPPIFFLSFRIVSFYTFL